MMHIGRVVVTFLALVWMLAGPALSQTFSGEWNSSEGRMSLTQTGDSLTGSYSGSGQVTGTVSGSYVRGTYVNGAYSGAFEFTLSPDGRNFTGRWWRPGRDVPWTGSRIGDPPVTPTAQTPPPDPTPQPVTTGDFTGGWDSNMGRMDLDQTGTRLVGTYASGATLTGTVSGRVARGTYENGSHSGAFEFTLSPDGTAFTGRWWRPGQDHPWTGTRITDGAASDSAPAQAVPSIEGIWQVEDATDGRNYNYWSTPWQFLPDGTVRSGDMWSGTWERREDGSFWMQILSDGELVDEYNLVLNRDHRFFAARQDGVDRHYGDRM